MIWHDLITMGIPVAEKAIRTVAVYLGIALLLRIAGKRDLAQLNTLDFVGYEASLQSKGVRG